MSGNAIPLNAASRHATLRYGFGIRRHVPPASDRQERDRDNAWFSMLDSEWPARKAAFERWLAGELGPVREGSARA